MSHCSRRTVLKGLALGAGSFLLGCSNQNDVTVAPSSVRRVRVRLVQDQTQVMLGASANPMVSTASAPTPRGLHFLDRSGAAVTLSPAGWNIGSVSFGIGDLVIQPATEGSLSVNGQFYRGSLRLVALSADHFDVINENLDVEGYLKGVLPRELYPHWSLETYRAQAIVARTYALYEVQTAGRNRYWDLYPDQRSQVYGGVGAETAISRQAVDDTAGIVLAYGPADRETIFKAYFSSCCGGVTQAASDAFGDPPLAPLSEQNVGPVCNACTKFNWNPVELKKDELTRRFHTWARRKAEQEGKARAEESMAAIDRVEIILLNRFGRPSRFRVTDVANKQYVLFSEEFRSAANSVDSAGEPTLSSSFLKIDSRPGSDVVRFVEGHGYGHGVGLCQWCAQARAERGMRHEDILAAAYPRARLVRAY
jgi:stage II sporulation protein D